MIFKFWKSSSDRRLPLDYLSNSDSHTFDICQVTFSDVVNIKVQKLSQIYQRMHECLNAHSKSTPSYS